MQIRWYQQSSHGKKCATSEKNRLPAVAIAGDQEREPELVAPDRGAQASPGPRTRRAGRPDEEKQRRQHLTRDAEGRERDDDAWVTRPLRKIRPSRFRSASSPRPWELTLPEVDAARVR